MIAQITIHPLAEITPVAADGILCPLCGYNVFQGRHLLGDTGPTGNDGRDVYCLPDPNHGDTTDDDIPY